jgi:hypothetical protein
MNRHDIDPVSVVFGSVFLAAVAWWALIQWIDINPPAVGWFLAGGLIVAGVVGLLAAARPRASKAPPASMTGPSHTPH